MLKISSIDVVISYSPIGDEPDPGSFLRANHHEHGVSIIPVADQSPDGAARAFTKEYAGKKVTVLVPGRAFDVQGTRHGRGGGWYDRFLSHIPREWLRVGVTSKERLSKGVLTRESHDESMDALLMWDGSKWDMITTDAR